MIILYAVFVNYPTVITEPATTYASYYSYTLNVAVMVLLGFGLIMTYLRSHSWSASAFSLLIVVLTMQYYILWNFFWSSVASNQFNRYVEITQEKIIRSLFASTAVLVSYGTVLGRVGPFEVFIMVIV
jgi:ammonium transporter Rh